MIEILIADDHSLVRAGLLSILRGHEDLRVVAEAEDGSEAFRLIRDLEPDIALLDQSMPMLVGTDVIQEATDAGLGTRFILLTMHSEPFLARQALHAGASGVVVKDDAVEVLLHAIRRVHEGQTFFSPSVDPEVIQDRDLLTAREKEILVWIARGLSNSEIAEELEISPRTVDTHRTRMMRKLGTHSSAELVSFAARSGLVRG